ncbi:MAG: hypothetical protein AAGD07_05390 [Planctomycetota bacterium]
MNHKSDPPDELPDDLHGIVTGIVNNPPPNDLADSVRSRLDLRFQLEPVASQARFSWTMAAVASAVVLVLGASLMLIPAAREQPTGMHESLETTPVPQPSLAAGPTLWAYHQAAIDSHERLDRLLSEHSVMMQNSDVAQSSRAGLFSLSLSLEDH